jgi:hypothetical protein
MAAQTFTMPPMKLRHFLCLLLLGLMAAAGVAGPIAAQPYIGEWSNGRGEPLIITASTIKFSNNAPVAYHDVTRGSDGKSFTLQLTAKGKLNYLSPFMRLTLNGKAEMSSEGADTFNGEMTSSAKWYRDK